MLTLQLSRRPSFTVAPGKLAALAPIFLLAAPALTWAQVLAAPLPATFAAAAIPSASKIFTYFLVMLGPMKLLGPFYRLTQPMELARSRKLATRAALLATLGGLVCVTIGRDILDKWSISLPALLLAAGLVLLLAALRDVLAQSPIPEAPANRDVAGSGVSANLAFTPIAFPYILPPYGAAALILLAAAANNGAEFFLILGIFVLVMVLDLAAMWFVRPLLKYGAGPLGLLGAVLGVLQVALAIQLLLVSARMLHLVS